MDALNNEHEVDIRFERMGAYVGQTLMVKHNVTITFGAGTGINQNTNYLGTIPTDSILQRGEWIISMRETGYGSALNESEAQWVRDNIPETEVQE